MRTRMVLFRALVCLPLVFLHVTLARAQPEDEKTVEQAFPGLATDFLKSAKMVHLKPGVILQCEDTEITEPQLLERIEKANPGARNQMRKNLFFLLEQEIVRQVLLQKAYKSEIPREEVTEDQAIRDYLDKAVQGVSVSEEEIKTFYDENKDLVGGMPLEQASEGIRTYLLQSKSAEFIKTHIRELARQVDLRINKNWVEAQYGLAMENPLDRARMSGKPTMAEFGATGCIPCDMMQPILDKLRQNYPDRLNVVFVHVREDPIMAARFGIQAIPVQVFFDKNGREVFRHAGIYSEAEILRKLSEMEVE